MVDCNNCKHVNFSEFNQRDNRIPHLCEVYGERVLHWNCIFSLVPCKKCQEDNFKNYEEVE